MRSASNRASEIGHPCLRYHLANRLLGHLKPPISEGLRGIFARGSAFEDWALGQLKAGTLPMMQGWRVLSYQSEVYDHALDLSGHPDFLLSCDNATMLVDTKSMTGGARMDSWERIPARFRGKYRAQLEVYMRLAAVDLAGLLIGDALSWTQCHLVACQPDDDLWAEILQRCERLRELTEAFRGVAAEALLGPDGIRSIEGEPLGSPHCKGCIWRDTIGCSWQADGVAMLSDPDLQAMLDRMQELRAFVKEHEALDEAVKAALKAACPEGGSGFCGSRAFQVKKVVSRRFEPTKEVKDAHPECFRESAQLRVAVEDDDE
jgi:hypothetical protein